jgi:two-component system sensor histidine kinase BarA
MTTQFWLGQREYWLLLLPSIFAATLIVGLWSVTLYQLDAARDSDLAAATKDAENFSRLLAVRTERAIDVVDQTVKLMKYGYDERGASVNLQTLVSGGVFGGVSGGVSVGLTHTDIVKRSGVAAIDTAYFSRIVDSVNSVNSGPQAVIALVGSDGVVRARRSAANDASANNVIDIPMLKAMALQDEGTLRTASAVDGIERLWAYRRLEAQPLYIVVGLGVDDSLQSFGQLRRHAMALASGATLLIVVFSALLTLLMCRLCLSRERAITESGNKSALLANMSHELRTPLYGILGYAELLRDELVDVEKRSFAQYIHDSGSHLLALVNSLLQMSKIEAGQVSIDLKTENLAALLGVAINTHASSAAAKGLKLSLTMAPDLPAELVCDRMRVMQVLNNLLHNAIKFTVSGKVELAVTNTAQGIRFSVSDTGPGIAPEAREAIFGSFFQVDRHSMDGTGLGLAIAKQVVQLMNGTIGIDSAQGHGATFFFMLPLKALS